MLKKIKQLLKYLPLVGMAPLIYSGMALASPDCNITPAHVSASMTVHLSKFGMNYPISRGDFHFSSVSPIRVENCTGGIRSPSDPITFKAHVDTLGKSADALGNLAWKIPVSAGALQLGLEPFTGEANYIDGTDKVYQFLDSSSDLVQMKTGIDIATLSNFTMPTNDSGTLIYNIAQSVMQASFGVSNSSYYATYSYTPYYDVLFMDNLTVNYIVSSCGIKSKQGSVVNWPSLTKSDVRNGKAATLPYSLYLICGNESDPATPVNITFSSTHGFADAANGIVNTNLQSVGIKLSWANTNLPPLVLDQVNRSTLSGTGDYSVLAKVVKTASENNVITGGHFDTNVTMTIEFP
jgi:type 1 fimbria pilin